ncbi:MAG: ATP-binding protein [Deltaproteobacteria bacterium]|nr:ATP-binding protein [Deltaproteobacteria bacterium]
MITPVESIAGRTIGTIVSVSPNEFSVTLEMDSPQSISLSTGAPRPFPRINGYLLVPNEMGAVVCIITWMGTEQSTFPKTYGRKESELVYLPFPKRKLTLTPIGTLIADQIESSGRTSYQLERGVSVFPSVGDSVVLPTKDELGCIVEGKNKDARLIIGIAPLAGGANVSVDPDKIFGRHLAVLGNTGSGKSCSVAGLIRWSLTAVKHELENRTLERANQKTDVFPNARFIILDPNGEYSRAFDDINGYANCRILSLSSRDVEGLALVAPHWAWSAEEWTGILRTGPGFQGPVLRLALQQIKDWSGGLEKVEGYSIIRFLSTWLMWLEWLINQGPKQYANFPGNKNVTIIIKSAIEWLTKYYRAEETPADLGDVAEVVEMMEEVKDSSFNEKGFQDPYNVNKLEKLKRKIIEVLGPCRETIPEVEGSADRPHPFAIDDLASTVEIMAERVGGDAAHYTRSMLLRLHRFREDADICSAIDSKGKETLENILRRTFGSEHSGDDKANVVILNLSFVPRDVLHIVISVLARIIFEALQWYRKLNDNNEVLPTVLVLEEAHTFVQRRIDSVQGELNPAQMCRQTFERIAREGRKFGLGLVLSSQRPSEVSPTVLAQCNTFLLHRIVNDQDQELVSKLVPDNLGGLLKELPNLPTRQAILLGWATPVPVLVEMKELDEEHRPQSKDPDFWDVWTGKEERDVNWKEIADHWQGKVAEQEEVDNAIEDED